HVSSLCAMLPPVIDDLAMQARAVFVDGDATVGAICSPRGVDVTVAKLVERGLFPPLLLAPINHELADVVAEKIAGRLECTAGRDLGQLVSVADEHDLPARARYLTDDPREVARADHARLVDDNNGSSADAACLSSARVREPGDCLRAYPAAGGQLR